LTLRSAGLLPALALGFILLGLAARFGAGSPLWAARIWGAGLVLTGAPVVWRTLRGIAAGRFAADLVAMLAIVAAVILREPLPGLIVVLMQTGGEALERYAQGRASEAVRELEAAAPRIAHRVTEAGAEDVPAESVAMGELILVRPGELLPCDGVVTRGRSHVDTSRITGEPTPVRAEEGVRLPSGTQNIEGPLTLRVTAPARESQYARIVELVRTAQASKSPLQRLADRYAVWFTPLTLVVCAAAYAAAHDPSRVLAVLVVATPCPLILATPVAVVGGINQAARRQIIFRHGTALEQLGRVSIGVFDKTGTLTIGRPRVARVLPVPPFSEAEVLRLAGAVEHGSSHLLARTLVDEVTARGLPIVEAHHVEEAAGQGVTGEVEGRTVAIGAWSFIVDRFPQAEADLLAIRPDGEGLRACVAVEGRGAGVVEYADEVRPGMREFFGRLRRFGVRRTLLLSGDHQANAEVVAHAVGMDEARGDLLPEEKVAYVRALVKEGQRVLMVGDGTNDAPALSSATVGIALASGGGGITAEAADAVVLADDPTRIAEAIAISRRTMRIARESIWAGLGLSAVAMGFAALGYIPPTIGALLQEAIDVAVILNALRASAPAHWPAGAPPHGPLAAS
jgi:heavy metal translocating P-type ATPase